MKEEIQPQEVYRDRRGMCYRVSSVARNIHTDEILVVYQEMFGGLRMLACPIDAFTVSMERDDKAGQGDATAAEDAAPDPGSEALSAHEKLIAFLDTRDFQEKEKILKELYLSNDLDDGMVDNMAASLDLVIEEGAIDKRFEQLKGCIQTRLRFESTRLR